MIQAWLKLLFGDNGTNDAIAWATLGGLLLFTLLVRAKTHARAHLGWGVLIAPLLAAIAGTIYALAFTRAGLSETVPFGCGVLIFSVMLWQFCRACQKWRLVQIVVVLTALVLTITVGIDALLNFWLSLNPSTSPDMLGHIANATSSISIWLLAASFVTVFIAFWVVIIRGIVRKVSSGGGGHP